MNEKILNDEELTQVTGGNGVILVTGSNNASYPSPTIPENGVLPGDTALSASGKLHPIPQKRDE